MKTPLALRVLIVSVIDIAVTDTVFYFHLKNSPTGFTPFKLVALILITLLPILATLYWWQVQQKRQAPK
jgi:uncharacterized membrane protein